MTAATSTAPPVTTRWVLDVPIALTSANDHVVNGRDPVARAQYKARRDKAAHALRMVARAMGVPLLDALPYVDRAGKPDTAARPVRAVHVVRLIGKGQREWDSDNLTAACKALRDACQYPRQWRGRLIAGAAIVVDDSAKWSTWTYAQERAPDGVARVRIEITETAGVEPARSEP